MENPMRSSQSGGSGLYNPPNIRRAAQRRQRRNNLNRQNTTSSGVRSRRRALSVKTYQFIAEPAGNPRDFMSHDMSRHGTVVAENQDKLIMHMPPLKIMLLHYIQQIWVNKFQKPGTECQVTIGTPRNEPKRSVTVIIQRIVPPNVKRNADAMGAGSGPVESAGGNGVNQGYVPSQSIMGISNQPYLHPPAPHIFPPTANYAVPGGNGIPPPPFNGPGLSQICVIL
ncbi:hypothetical protein GGS21DRAFT_145298 [Xylaria nigripes]|nr:hypothetical protein GGS21DRAFT_145298 [Xylaria nigripes]